MKLKLAFALSVLAGSASAMELSCYLTRHHVCAVPISAIYADESAWLGRTLALKGFLALEGGEYVVYPDELSLKHGSQEAALRVLVENEVKDADVLIGKYVQVVGQLRLNKSSPYFADFVAAQEPRVVYLRDAENER